VWFNRCRSYTLFKLLSFFHFYLLFYYITLYCITLYYTILYYGYSNMLVFIRSTLLIISIWGSDVRPPVRPYVRPQKVFPIPMKFGMCVEVDEWCTTVCRMTRSKVKVTRPLKLEILRFSKSISSPIFNVSWQMTTDSETTEQYLTFVRSRFFYICPSYWDYCG